MKRSRRADYRIQRDDPAGVSQPTRLRRGRSAVAHGPLAEAVDMAPSDVDRAVTSKACRRDMEEALSVASTGPCVSPGPERKRSERRRARIAAVAARCGAPPPTFGSQL